MRGDENEQRLGVIGDMSRDEEGDGDGKDELSELKNEMSGVCDEMTRDGKGGTMRMEFEDAVMTHR